MIPASEPGLDSSVFVPEVGATWFGRLQLEVALESRVPAARWRVKDLRTGTIHTLEILPREQIVRLSDADRAQLVEPFIHATVPGLLSHCRLEGTWPAYQAISAFDAVLASASLAHLPRPFQVEPALALRWFFSAGETVAQLHDAGLRAHGAVVPSRIWTRPDGSVLLTGYPFAIWSDVSSEENFLSPQRRKGAPPDPSDDVFSLGALGYHLLTGGQPPPDSTPAADRGIDYARTQSGLPATGWARGWDQPLLAALAPQATLRPSSLRALLARLSELTGQVLPESSKNRLGPKGPVSSRRVRRPASWRVAKRPETAFPSALPSARVDPNADRIDPLNSLRQVRAERADLDRERAELDRRASLLNDDLAQAAARRAEIARRDDELERDKAEYNEARVGLTAALEQLKVEKGRFAEQTQALEEQQRQTRAEDSRRLAELQALKQEIDAQKTANEARLTQLNQLERELKNRTEEAGRRERAVDESEKRIRQERLDWQEQQAEAERRRQASISSEATPSAPKETAEVAPASELIALREETREIAAQLKLAEAQREKLEQELGTLRSQATERPDTRERVAELTRSLTERDAELSRKAAELDAWKKEREGQEGAVSEARKALETERKRLTEGQTALEKDRRTWEEEVRKERIAREAAEKTLSKKASKAAAPAALVRTDGTTTSPAAPPPSKTLWIVGGAGALVAIVLGFLVFRFAGEASRLRESAASSAPAVAAARPSTVVVVTDPAGAEISIAGQPPRSSPATFEGLPSGPVQLRATKEGYRPQERTVQIREGATTVTDVLVLNPVAPAAGPTGWLYVRTRPVGAQVSLPGAPAGPAPLLLRDLPAGPARVSVRLDGYLPVERVVEIKPGEDSVVDLTLQPAPPPPRRGALTITTDPAGAEILIDGKPAQASPATLQDLAPGRVTLTVRRTGYEPVEQTVEVRAGETVTVPRISLKPKIVATPTPPPLVLPKATSVLAGAVELKLARVEPGEVVLGDGERGRSTVTISRPFLMAETEISQAAYTAVMGENPSALRERRVPGPSRTIMEDFTTTVMSGGRPTSVTQKRPKVVPGEEVVTALADNPVENVTWEQAMEFCARLTRAATAQGKLPPGTVVRLPTEAEWDLARTRGTATVGTDGRAAFERLAWLSENAEGGHRAIRTKAADAGGLFDLNGNVAEWCIDAWSTQVPPDAARDPIVLDAPQQALLGSIAPGTYSLQVVTDAFNRRVVRGGSFRTDVARLLATPYRASQPSRADDLGFRIVVAAPIGSATVTTVR